VGVGGDVGLVRQEDDRVAVAPQAVEEGNDLAVMKNRALWLIVRR
jgi:hypothetical protein